MCQKKGFKYPCSFTFSSYYIDKSKEKRSFEIIHWPFDPPVGIADSANLAEFCSAYQPDPQKYNILFQKFSPLPLPVLLKKNIFSRNYL